jgi:hypothetical protein
MGDFAGGAGPIGPIAMIGDTAGDVLESDLGAGEVYLEAGFLV